MPYIITVIEKHSIGTEEVASRAAGSIDDAREMAAEEIENSRPPVLATFGLMEEAARLPVSGGTIGPLPDGIRISVTSVDRAWLIQQTLGTETWMTTDRIVAAYNEAQQ